MTCPNYLLCKNNENNHNGVCYTCDSSLYGYFNKSEMLNYGHEPSIDQNMDRSSTHYNNNKISKEVRQELQNILETNRLTTGILQIEEYNDECPLCLEDKNIFIVHPTCKIHKICKDCFKKSFVDEYSNVLIPIEPECYKTFINYLSENELDIVYDLQVDESYKSQQFCYISEDYPEYIREIYPICLQYDVDRVDYEELIDKEKIELEYLRKCPICREHKLKI